MNRLCLFSFDLDWESPDHFQWHTVDDEARRRVAEAWNADPKRWARRVQIAQEIVEAGLDAMKRDLIADDSPPTADQSLRSLRQRRSAVIGLQSKM